MELNSLVITMGDELNMPAATPAKNMRCSSPDEEEPCRIHLQLQGSDPIRIHLDFLHNQLKDKDRELAEAHSEIKALRLTSRAKDKALSEADEELQKVAEKLQASEAALENKNLEIKRVTDEKKAAVAAQFVAEATLRRVYATQKDEELPPLEAILLPLEAEIKLLRHELSALQDDNKALERLTKSKEVALLEAEREVQVARTKAALVDELQNRNQELTKQNEICQEEYKILDKMHRLKVAEVEKLGQTVHELEEALLSGAAAANAVRDYQRQVSELKGEKRTLERTLSRAKVTENRVAVVIANEWKDANDKVMPVKQWLEERRVLMGEMQQLRDKLAVAERATKAEAQLKERFQLRLKVLEDALRSSPRSGIRQDVRSNTSGLPQSRSVNAAEFSAVPLSSGIAVRIGSDPVGRSSTMSRSANTMLKHAKGVSRSFDGGRLSYDVQCQKDSVSEEIEVGKEVIGGKSLPRVEAISGDSVSAVFYDILQKEVITLRKACHEKEQNLKDKDNFIETLSRKVDTLSKAMEVETKKLRREKAAIEKNLESMRVEKEPEQKARRLKGLSNILHS